MIHHPFNILPMKGFLSTLKDHLPHILTLHTVGIHCNSRSHFKSCVPDSSFQHRFETVSTERRQFGNYHAKNAKEICLQSHCYIVSFYSVIAIILTDAHSCYKLDCKFRNFTLHKKWFQNVSSKCQGYHSRSSGAKK